MVTTRMPLVSWGARLIAAQLAELQFPHFLFKVGNVLPAISNVRVHFLLHQRVIGRLPHVRRSGDEGLLPLDLAVDGGHKLIVTVHDCGIEFFKRRRLET